METLLFLIIAGILSMVFGKGKGKDNKPFQTGKPFKANTFDDIKKLFQAEINKETETDYKEVINKENIQKTVVKVKQELTDSQPNWISPQQAPVTQHSIIGTLGQEKVETEQPLFSERPDGDTLINGIIWGEILGEPRSRKPYFPNKR